MDTLNSTEPHYIRCVKPNNLSKPSIFESTNVMQQLRSGGVLEAIRIKCAGYPTHRTFSEFLQHFAILALEILKGNSYEEKVACKWILEKMELTGYQIGKTKVFLRAGQMAELNAQRARVFRNSAQIIQREIKTYSTRKKYVAKRRASIRIQSFWRGKLARDLYKSTKKEAAAVKIQKNLRRQVATKSYTNVKSSALVLQTGIRSMVARNEFRCREKNKAAIIIQAYWRCHSAFSYYKKLKKASVVSQSRMRERFARKEFRGLKMAARGTDQSDIEDAKEQEKIRLQQAMQEMQNILDETSSSLVKECEAEQKQIEEAHHPIIKESSIPVQYAENTEALTEEVEKLNALLKAEKQRADDFEKKYAESQELSEKRRQRLEETERRVHQLQISLKSVSQDDILHVRSIHRAKNDPASFIKLKFSVRAHLYRLPG